MRALHCLLGVALIGLLSGCKGVSEGPPEGRLQDQPQGAIEELVQPQTARLEPGVRSQIEGALAKLEALTEASPAADRGGAWGELGQLYHAYEFEVAAMTCYRNAGLLDPDEFRWAYYLGQLERERGELAAAESALSRAIALQPDDVVARLELARLRLDQARPEDALGEIERVLEQHPDSPAALLVQARVLLEQQAWPAAIAVYERLLELQPRASRLHQQLATAYRGAGDLERAAWHLERRGDGPVQAEDAWGDEIAQLRSGLKHTLDEAESRFQRRDFAGAEAAYVEAIAIAPDTARAYLGRGSALKELGRLAEALEQYDQALTIQPEYALAHYNRGVVLAQLGDDAAAIAAYDRALAIDPEYAEARFNRANALLRSSRSADALAAYERVMADNPGNGAAHLGRAVALLHLDRDPQAVASLIESDRVFSGNLTFKNALARVWATSSEATVRAPERALGMASQLVAAAPTAVHVETLAMAQAASGDFESAIATLERLLEAVLQAGAEAAAEPYRAQLESYRRGEAPADPRLD